MKIMTIKKYGLGIATALVVILAGWNAWSDKGGVGQVIKHSTAPFDSQSIGSVPPAPQDTVLAHVPYQGGAFRVETRKDKIERFRCSHFHNYQPATIAKAAETAHGDIILDHGDKDKQLACFTCHNKENRDVLITEKGTAVDMDHSYELCAQCHFRQKMDWTGGAHGKRVGGWAGERVVKNCTACHNPHAPRFEKRWPTTYSRPLTE